MRKFLLKAIAFLTGVILITHLLAGVAKELDPPDGLPYRIAEGDRNARLLAADLTMIDAIAVGNSHSDSLDFATLDLNGEQLNRAGGDLFEANYYVQNFLPKMPAVDTAFIAVSYFALQRNNVSWEGTRLRRIYLYTSLPFWRFIPGDFATFVVGRIDSMLPVKDLVRGDSWEGVLQAFAHNGLQFIVASNAVKADGGPDMSIGECQHMSQDRIMADAETAANTHVSFSQEMIARHADLESETVQVLSGMIESLQARDVRVVLHTPPYPNRYTDVYENIDKDSMLRQKAVVSTLARHYGVEYYDFSTDEEIVFRTDLFRNGDHLNRCGARLYSQKLRSMLDGTPN